MHALSPCGVKLKYAPNSEERMTPDQEKSLRKHLLDLLAGGQAHAKFDDVVKGLPAKLRGAKPAKFPHTPWMLLEHLRIAQWDILEFSRNAEHVSPNWPRGYWPEAEAPPTAAAWNKSIQQFRKDLKALQRLVADPKTDLFARIPWGDGQTRLREVLLVADHNAYHLGQFVDVRRMLGAWKG
jgi:DinB superfamily